MLDPNIASVAAVVEAICLDFMPEQGKLPCDFVQARIAVVDDVLAHVATLAKIRDLHFRQAVVATP